MAISTPTKLSFHSLPSLASTKRRNLWRTCCGAPPQSQSLEIGIMCEPCGGKGWLVCDFCDGKKTNVKAENKRIYRRCPSCRAIGYLLCTKCKVYKCVVFPTDSDGEL